jgi:hypothetical protein
MLAEFFPGSPKKANTMVGQTAQRKFSENLRLADVPCMRHSKPRGFTRRARNLARIGNRAKLAPSPQLTLPGIDRI